MSARRESKEAVATYARVLCPDCSWCSQAVAVRDEPNPGPRPEVHRDVLERHRAEWPTLWRAIDALVAPETD